MSVYPTPAQKLAQASQDIAQQEAELKILRKEIEYARKKAESYRKRAAAQDAIADAKVKECAALGTPALPIVDNPVADDKTYPQLAKTAAYPRWNKEP